jgi:predicted PurR-regulated permease PerM
MKQTTLMIVAAGLILFIFAIVYIVRYQTSAVHQIFKHHREQLENEIQAIKQERERLKKSIDSLEYRINLEQENLIIDIDNFLKNHGKR